MAIVWTCGCGRVLKARDELTGKRTKCPSCGAVQAIPAPEVDPDLGDGLPYGMEKPDPPPDPADYFGTMAKPEEYEPIPQTVLPKPKPSAPWKPAPVVDDFASDGLPYGLDEPDPPPPPKPETQFGTMGADEESTLRPVRPSTRPSSSPASPSSSPSSSATFSPSKARPSAKKPAAPKPKAAGQASGLEYTYLLLFFALIPLIIATFTRGEPAELPDRIGQTLEAATPEQRAAFEAKIREIKDHGDDGIAFDKLLLALPNGKLTGAHLARDSFVHWLYALVATAGFLLLLMACFSVERAKPLNLLAIGLFTSTFGIVFLTILYWLLRVQGFLRGRFPIYIWAFILVLRFIAWSYHSADDPDSPFVLSALGFTLGVGLIEELTKALPLLFYYKRYAEMGWRGACLWGLASGIGFGVAEGIMYSGNKYNGIAGLDAYLIRFLSCVALHAIWTATVAISIARRVDDYEAADDAASFGLFALRVLAIPMILHGLYDTLLTRDMPLLALVVALASFGWLVVHVELARGAHPGAGLGKRKARGAF